MKTPTIQSLIDEHLLALRRELYRAMSKHGPIASPHEGYAVILEELDELWEHVKHDEGRSAWANEEAIQIAAMGMRYAIDLCSGRK